jgi:hypothetical protein
MQNTLSPVHATGGFDKRTPFAERPQAEPRSLPHRRRPSRSAQALARYSDGRGHLREVVSLAGAAGTVLVVDRDAATHHDGRLLAHLAADEPPENASLICRQFVEDALRRGGRCRALTADDLSAEPFDLVEGEGEHDSDLPVASPAVQVRDCRGRSYMLAPVEGDTSIPQLRWCRRPPGEIDGSQAICLREVVAALESYEPVQALTLRAVARAGRDPRVSTAVLRAELARVQGSPIVLNRRLREVVLAIMAGSELSMSSIAIRCGRIKRDRKGNESGETSWLARRLGLLPDSGHSLPTPWIHSDVLGLIARQGLGLSPREVEV